MNPAEALWARHHPLAGYPKGVVAVPEPIRGLAFFPGGFGLWGSVASQPLAPFPRAGVMILGHDFHSEAGYQKSRRLGGEPLTLPTWRNLVALLAAASIAPERCFFTNLYMGLRDGRKTTGRFPGASNPDFVQHCKSFLLEQLRTQVPALIVTLGTQVPPVLGALSPELAHWTAGTGLKHLDGVGPVQKDVHFRGVDGFETTVVALIHPSMRHASLRHRRYKEAAGNELVGAEAELAMLRNAAATAFPASDA
jgi:uracil-DNA glycosylase